jgi:hypothetical protein
METGGGTAENQLSNEFGEINVNQIVDFLTSAPISFSLVLLLFISLFCSDLIESPFGDEIEINHRLIIEKMHHYKLWLKFLRIWEVT